MGEISSVDQYSTWIGLIYVFNLIIGTGALTLPAIFGRAGWLIGTIVILILSFISYVTVTYIIEAIATANAIITWNKIQERKKSRSESERSGSAKIKPHSESSDSEETPLVPSDSAVGEQNVRSIEYFSLQDKIEMGEMATMFFSKFGVTLFYVCLTLYLYGDLSIYGAAIGESTVDVFCTYLPQNFSCNDTIGDNELCWDFMSISRLDAYRVFLTTFVALLGPFAFFNVQKTKYLQILTSFMRWLAFLIMIVYALQKLIINGPQGHPPMANIKGIPSLFGAAVYSFMCHHSLPALVSPISNKSSLNRYLASDYLLIAFFYLLLALTGVFAFEHLENLYTLDFSPRGSGNCVSSDNPLMILIEYFLALFPVFTLSTNFPIIAITLRNNLKSLYLTSRASSGQTRLHKLVFPLLAVLPPYLVAMSTHDLSKLVGFTGSYAGAAIQYLVPTCLVYYARSKTESILGPNVKNRFASPFAGNKMFLFVIVWAVTCMVLVSINLIEVHFLMTPKGES